MMFYFPVHLFGILTVLSGQTLSKLCSNERCCDGYRWNENGTSCIACPIGFRGTQCEKPCDYPLYGKICQSICPCSKNQCNVATGCLQGSVSEFPMSTSHRILPTSSTSTERSDTETSGSLVERCPSLQKSNYVMKTSIFVLLGLAIVMLIIYFFVQVRFRQKVNTPIAHI